MNDTKSQESEVRMVGIVRDKDGNPRFDDPDNIPEAVMAALTPEDIDYLNRLRTS